MLYLNVECYSGYKGNQRPVQFSLGDQTLKVECIEDQWYSPGVIFFRVQASNGNIYVLRHDEINDTWILEAFRSV